MHNDDEMKRKGGEPATKNDLWAHEAATRRDFQAHTAATRKDFKAHKAATRKDLEAHKAASRRDLETHAADIRKDFEAHRAATRKDFEAHAAATRKDLEAHATKSELRQLALEIVKTNGRIDRLEVSLTEKINSMGSRIINTVDGFMSQVGKIDRAQVIADWRLSEMEKRVGAIESRPS